MNCVESINLLMCLRIDIDSTILITAEEDISGKPKLIKETFIKYKQENNTLINGRYVTSNYYVPTNKELTIKLSVVPHLITGAKGGSHASRF